MPLFKIDSFRVSNFRNLEGSTLNFSRGINCILGQNGNGKTNLLEAIFYLSNKKSFRKNTSFPQFLSADGEKPEIVFQSALFDGDERVSYSGKVEKNQQHWYLSGKPTKIKSITKAVFVSPFDSYQFHHTPSFRRNLIDTLLSLQDESYKKLLSKFDKSLRFRNKILSFKSSEALRQLKAIDEQFVHYSFEIKQRRLSFVSEVNRDCGRIFKEIFCENHDLSFNYESKFLSSDAERIGLFYAYRMKDDLEAGTTRYGVHRDDYLFLFDGMNSYEYCSLGQQKMSYLSLLFAYIELFRYKFKAYPIVLIDDISGELDDRRWKNLIKHLREKEFQVFITTANENFKKELDLIGEATKIYVTSGSFDKIQ